MMPPGQAWRSTPRQSAQRGSVLIIVLWIAFGLVSMALYFAHTMSFELRAADNRVASLEADQAINAAVCYVSNILATTEYPGTLPDPTLFRTEAVAVGDAAFWLIGRSDFLMRPEEPWFQLVDEGAKLNVNVATAEMLEWLPGMTPEMAAAIVDWRDSDSEVSEGGVEDESYQRLNPPYRCKNAAFDSVDELRLVYGMDLGLLFGEDANLNGVLDPNENDADQSFPLDNRDGRLDAGLLEYLTVYSKQPTTRTNGSPRIDITGTNQQELASLLMEKFDTEKANQILSSAGLGGGGGGGGRGGGGAGASQLRSVLEFYIRSGMTAAEFAEIESDLTAGTNAVGLVNVNTAPEAVLACIPGIGIDNAPTLVAQRQRNGTGLTALPSLAWVADVLDQTNAVQAGPYLTGQSYQFTADVAAVGHYGRGFRRARFVFDTSEGTPRALYRQDLTHLGWALGTEVRRSLQQLATNRQ